MRVLVACEFSGIVRDAFARRGHDAWSCDLLPSETPGNHYQGDVLPYLEQSWDLIIAHPPCTYLTNAGVCHLYNGKARNEQRWADMLKGAEFFKQLLNANIPKIAIENPLPHGYAVKAIGRKYDQRLQPWMFGHRESKGIFLWLEGLPPLMSTCNVKNQMIKLPKREQQRIHYMSPGPERSKERSRFYPGIGDAMATQWG